jgi:hypothetical protein
MKEKIVDFAHSFSLFKIKSYYNPEFILDNLINYHLLDEAFILC